MTYVRLAAVMFQNTAGNGAGGDDEVVIVTVSKRITTIRVCIVFSLSRTLG